MEVELEGVRGPSHASSDKKISKEVKGQSNGWMDGWASSVQLLSLLFAAKQLKWTQNGFCFLTG